MIDSNRDGGQNCSFDEQAGVVCITDTTPPNDGGAGGIHPNDVPSPPSAPSPGYPGTSDDTPMPLPNPDTQGRDGGQPMGNGGGGGGGGGGCVVTPFGWSCNVPGQRPAPVVGGIPTIPNDPHADPYTGDRLPAGPRRESPPDEGAGGNEGSGDTEWDRERKVCLGIAQRGADFCHAYAISHGYNSALYIECGDRVIAQYEQCLKEARP